MLDLPTDVDLFPAQTVWCAASQRTGGVEIGACRTCSCSATASQHYALEVDGVGTRSPGRTIEPPAAGSVYRMCRTTTRVATGRCCNRVRNASPEKSRVYHFAERELASRLEALICLPDDRQPERC